MKVSFLVTFYNQERFVAQALDSILALEKPFDWEIRVGDDGSADGTADAVRAYMERYPEHIFLHIMPRDQSKKYNPVIRLGANKLNLMKHATGDFFCNLDGDDRYCDTTFVAEALKIYEQHPELSVVAFGYKTIVDNVETGSFVLPREGIIPKGEYLRSMYTTVCACVLRFVRDQERMDYINSMGYYDDNIIVANNLYYGELYAVPRAIYGYRQNSNSITTSMREVDTMAHNSQGFDIDVKLVREENKPDVLRRYAFSILGIYTRKTKLRQYIGDARYEMYVSECREIPDSLTYKILVWKQLDRQTRREVRRTVFPLLKENWFLAAKMMVKNLIGR